MARRIKARHYGGSLNCALQAGKAPSASNASLCLGNGSGDFTIACWVKAVVGAATTRVAFGIFSSVYNDGALVYAFSGGLISFRVRDTIVVSTTITGVNQWHRYVITATGSSRTFEAFIDGVSQGVSAQYTAGAFPSPAIAYVGDAPAVGSGGDYTADLVVDIGHAWTSAQIASDYFDGIQPTTISHRWPLDDGAGTTCRATVGNAGVLTPNVGNMSADSPMLGRNVVRNFYDYSGGSDVVWTRLNTTTALVSTPTPISTTITRLTESSDSGVNSPHIYYRPAGIPLANGGDGRKWILSAVAKANGRSWISLFGAGGIGSLGVYFDLTNVALGLSVGAVIDRGIQDLGNGYVQCWFSFISTGTAAFTSGIWIASSNGVYSYPGTGLACVDVAGMQLEPASAGQTTPSPYVATGATPLSVYGAREVRQNLLLWSEDASNAAYNISAAGMTVLGGQVGLHSATSATKLTVTAVSAYRYQNTARCSNGERYAGSVWLWTDTPGKSIGIRLASVPSGTLLQQKTIVLTTTPTRYDCAGVVTSATDTAGITFGVDNRVAQAGDGVASGTVFCEGFQLKQSNAAGDYIKTTSTPANSSGAPRSNS